MTARAFDISAGAQFLDPKVLARIESLELLARVVERQGIGVQVGAAGGRLPFGLGTWPFEAVLTTSILGSLDEQRAVLEHAHRGELEWHVETLPLEHANDALERLRAGDVLGRLVLVP